MTSGQRQFGDCVLDLDRGVLLRAGEEVPLRPKSFEVLRYLVEHPGRLVTREELLDAVWGSVVVTEGSVAKCLIDVRRAIGDEDQRVVRTIPKRGYLFEPDPPAVSPPPLPRPPRWNITWILAGAAIAIAMVLSAWVLTRSGGSPVAPEARVETSIAVLPFADLSIDDSQRHLADGLSEELIHVLTQELPVPVIARTSSFMFRDGRAGVPEIARRLGVTHVLEGSVRRSNEQLRVTAQLIDGATGQHLWSQTYDRAWTDVLALQQDIAHAIAAKLKVSMAQSAKTVAAGVSPAAIDEYLQGQFYYNRREPGDMANALASFQKAVALDPNYARAWASLSATYMLMGYGGEMPRGEALERQLQAAQRAVTLDSTLTDARMRYAAALEDRGETARALAEFSLAARSDPNNVLVLGGRASSLMRIGRIDEAVALARKALRLDPMSIVARANLASYLYNAGQYDEALEQLDTVDRLANPAGLSALGRRNVDYSRILVVKSRFADAQAIVETLPEEADRAYGQALLAIAQGRKADAEPWLERLSSAIDTSTRDPDTTRACTLAFYMAELHGFRGDLDVAFRWLERGTKLARGLYAPGRDDFRYSPFAVAMRDDPRWSAWLRNQPELQP